MLTLTFAVPTLTPRALRHVTGAEAFDLDFGGGPLEVSAVADHTSCGCGSSLSEAPMCALLCTRISCGVPTLKLT